MFLISPTVVRMVIKYHTSLRKSSRLLSSVLLDPLVHEAPEVTSVVLQAIGIEAELEGILVSEDPKGISQVQRSIGVLKQPNNARIGGVLIESFSLLLAAYTARRPRLVAPFSLHERTNILDVLRQDPLTGRRALRHDALALLVVVLQPHAVTELVDERVDVGLILDRDLAAPVGPVGDGEMLATRIIGVDVNSSALDAPAVALDGLEHLITHGLIPRFARCDRSLLLFIREARIEIDLHREFPGDPIGARRERKECQ